MHLAEGITLKEGLVGGLILGTSASAFMYLTGKITGLSGIIEGLVVVEGQDWHISYVLGLIASGYIGSLYFPDNFPQLEISNYTLAISGVVIGFGTRLAGGCTSGHGLCGLGRFSPRSLTAVLTFMGTAIATATITQSSAYKPYFLADPSSTSEENLSYVVPLAAAALMGLLKPTATQGVDIPTSQKISASTWSVTLTSFLAGLTFGAGLVISGMASSEKVLRFLDFTGVKGWDPTLAAVLGGGVSLTALAFPYFQRSRVIAPLGKQDLSKSLKIGTVSENLVIDWKLVVGSILFGVGWGITGICPGPGIVNLIPNIRVATIYIPALLSGILFKDALFRK